MNENKNKKWVVNDARIEKLEEQVATLTSVVEGLESESALKVDKNKIISSINTSDEGVKIHSSRILINGEVVSECIAKQQSLKKR